MKKCCGRLENQSHLNVIKRLIIIAVLQSLLSGLLFVPLLKIPHSWTLADDTGLKCFSLSVAMAVLFG